MIQGLCTNKLLRVCLRSDSHGRIIILSLFMNIHFIWGYEVTDLWYLPLHESIFRRSRNLKLFPTFDILFVKMEPQTTPESGRFSKKTIWCDMDSRCARLTNIWTGTNKPGNYLNPVVFRSFEFHSDKNIKFITRSYIGPQGSSLKWTVLGQSGRSEEFKLDGPKVRTWTVTYESGRSKSS